MFMNYKYINIMYFIYLCKYIYINIFIIIKKKFKCICMVGQILIKKTILNHS